MAEREYLSIGEVLSLLVEEFPDVTISKIRFLESQGLIDPERTASGYRKFYAADVERLRFILREQREHFLPLKVIKDRLDDDATESSDSPEPAVVSASAEPVDTSGHPSNRVPAWLSDPRLGQRSVKPTSPSAPTMLTTGVSLTTEELCEATGLASDTIKELERFGLVTGRVAGRFTYYDEDALVVARLAAQFARRGVESRHLRMFRTSVDREAALFEQLILPLIKQRNPQARAQAMALIHELNELGSQMRTTLMHAAIRSYIEPG